MHDGVTIQDLKKTDGFAARDRGDEIATGDRISKDLPQFPLILSRSTIASGPVLKMTFIGVLPKAPLALATVEIFRRLVRVLWRSAKPVGCIRRAGVAYRAANLQCVPRWRRILVPVKRYTPQLRKLRGHRPVFAALQLNSIALDNDGRNGDTSIEDLGSAGP